jgi:DNA mismatch repair protein MutL
VNKIIQLDDNTISKIAAGEVIERPASVVKELVENSIDSGSRSITIEIKDGGRKAIRVSDDGSGMNKDDAKACVKRHTTSKIKDAKDIFSITSLGFRGEALASIAAVSHFELITNDGNSDIGTKINIDGGTNPREGSAGHPKGTTITVNELFYNTPARLKFQKSKNTEMSHIIDVISKFILARPEISFKLISDGGVVLSSVGSGKLIEAIASVYGSDMATVMIEVGGDASGGRGVKVHGFVSQPVVTKSDRNGESFFVNGRNIRNMLLSRALEDPYRSLIPSTRFPISVIFVDIDPADIDVNVHPTKREIKFASADQAMSAVRSAVSKALSAVSVNTQSAAAIPSWNVSTDAASDRLIISDTMPSYDAPSQGISFNSFAPMFQINDTYIVAADGLDLLLIDQHAAHERIMYERLKKNEILSVQELLVPLSVELEPKLFALVGSNIEPISRFGMGIEVFGHNTIRVRAVPSYMVGGDITKAVKELFSELSEDFKVRSIPERQDAILKTMACKAAVKAGDRLTHEEMDGLIKELRSITNPTTCPHGRPCMQKIKLSDLEKMFHR